jgi:hypothetical protein
MTISENTVISAQGSDVKTNRSELLTGLGAALIGAGMAAFVLRAKGTSSITTLSFVGRGVALYASFQLVPFFRKHIDTKLNRTLKIMAAVWIVSVLAQGLSLATAFAKPLLVTIALVDFALRAIAFAQARSVTLQLHRSVANTLVIGSIARLATGAMMITLAASGATRFSNSAGMIVVAELGATLLAAAFVEMSLPKHFAAKALQSSTVAAAVDTGTVNGEAIENGESIGIVADQPIASIDSIDSIDVVLDLRHAEAIQASGTDTVVDLREHVQAAAK